MYRNAQSHVLNQKAVAATHAKTLEKSYEDCRFVVCHIDGGITVGAHDRGRMIDGNVGSGGDGPFTPTRTGSVPVMRLLDYVESHSVEEARLLCHRAGGFVSHFGTADADRVHAMVDARDPKATLIWNAMIYQICKEVGAMNAVLCGRVDGILLTGRLVRFDDVVGGIRERCGWIAPVTVYPDELEQEELAGRVMDVLEGKAEARVYSGKPVWSGFDFGEEEII